MLESIHIHTAWSHIASSARCMYEGSSLTVPIYRGVLYTSILTCPRSCFSCAWEAPKKSAERGSMSLSGHVPLAPLRLRVSENRYETHVSARPLKVCKNQTARCGFFQSCSCLLCPSHQYVSSLPHLRAEKFPAMNIACCRPPQPYHPPWKSVTMRYLRME